MAYTITIHNGSDVCQKHNNRDKDTIAKEEHIDPTGEHITLRHIDIRKAYHKFFGKALNDYNEKTAKKHPDRCKTMQQYINEIFAKKDTLKQSIKPAYELIVQVGDKDNAPDDETCKAIFEEYLNDFESNNKTLKIIGAYIHNDELGGIHMHLDYIPCAECKRGMALQPSMNKALEQIGFTSDTHKDTALIKFEKAERERLTQICNIYNLKIEAAKGGKKHMETELFKLEQELEQLKKKFDDTTNDNEELRSQIAILKKEIKQLEEEKEMASKYYNDKKMTFKQVKEDIDKNYNEAVENYRNEAKAKLEQDKKDLVKSYDKEFEDFARAEYKRLAQDKANVSNDYKKKLKELGLGGHDVININDYAR